MKTVYLIMASLLAAAPAWACQQAPRAIIDIDANSYYSDANHSVIDPARRAKNIASTRPVEDFLSGVARSASRYQASGKPADAACALGWLAQWAGSGAMLGRMSSAQAYSVRKWTLGGLALSYARVREEATPAQRQAIDTWLGALADATISHAQVRKGVRNNHYYWEGMAVTAVGAVTKNQRYLAWGREVFDFAMGQVAEDGSLPAEMARGAKALHYHVFAAAPLAMIESMLDLQSLSFERVVKFTLAAASDPSALKKATGFTQEKPDSMPFVVIYQRHHGQATSAATDPAAAAAKATWQARLGGDLTLPNPLEHPAP